VHLHTAKTFLPPLVFQPLFSRLPITRGTHTLREIFLCSGREVSPLLISVPCHLCSAFEHILYTHPARTFFMLRPQPCLLYLFRISAFSHWYLRSASGLCFPLYIVHTLCRNLSHTQASVLSPFSLDLCVQSTVVYLLPPTIHCTLTLQRPLPPTTHRLLPTTYCIQSLREPFSFTDNSFGSLLS
jgi:hypothetical protein